MHFTHLGRVGLMHNYRWGEIFDFALGFLWIDFANDDGVKRGHWPWLPPPAKQPGEGA